jgi:4-hydroxy-tetrahydrodipicolinate synthase/2-dehydro-3-deoxy-phosphogluconate/2-dehydro-3-deoxy-6-phosphogalactonate aldolase
MITPRNDDGSLSVDGVKILVDHLVESGVDVIFPTGSAGEGPLLTGKQKEEIIAAVVEAVDGRVAVTPGITCTTTRETIELGKACDDLGVDAVVAVTPWYYKITDSDLFNFFENIASSIDSPIIAYKIPQAAVNDITLDLLDKLSKVDGIAAIKDSSGDVVWLSKAITQHGDTLKFFGGNDRLMLPCLSIGASGHVSGSSNCFTEEVVDTWKHFKAGDIDSARKSQQMLLKKLMLLPPGKENSAIREVLRSRGIDAGEPLLPLGSLTAEEKMSLANGLKSLEA